MTAKPCEKRIRPWQRIEGATPTFDNPQPFAWRHVCECCEKQVTMTRDNTTHQLNKIDADLRAAGYEVAATEWADDDGQWQTIEAIQQAALEACEEIGNGPGATMRVAHELRDLVAKLIGQIDGLVPTIRHARLASEVSPHRPHRCRECTDHDRDDGAPARERSELN